MPWLPRSPWLQWIRLQQLHRQLGSAASEGRGRQRHAEGAPARPGETGLRLVESWGNLDGLSLDGFCHENMVIGALERTKMGGFTGFNQKTHGDCDLYVILKDCLKGTSTTNIIVLDPQTHGLYCIFSNQFWDKWICIAGWYGIQHPSRNTFICSPFLYIWQSMCLKFQITNRCII